MMSAAGDEGIADLEEEEEDLPLSRVRRPRRRGADSTEPSHQSQPSIAGDGAADAEEPSQEPGHSIAHAPTGQVGKYTTWEKVLLVVAVAIGVIFGVWFAGRPSTPSDVPSQEISSATDAGPVTQVDPALRMAELQALLAAYPDDVPSLIELGVLLFDNGQYDQASTHWLRATELNPLQAQAWYNLGFYYLSTTPPNYEAAQDAWDKVLTIAPDSEMAATIESHLSGLIPDDIGGG